MTKAEAIRFFGNQTKLAAALGIKRSAISQWGDEPPPLRQYQLQQLTNGKLKAATGEAA